MPTALPSPAKVGTAPRAGSAAEKLETALKRARGALDKAKERGGAIAHTAICTAEIQAACGVASFTSGYMNGKGKSLKVWGIDARLPLAIVGVGSGMLWDSVGTHGMALGNGVLASLVAEKAYDMGVSSAKKAAEGSAETPPAEGVYDDEDDEDETSRRSADGRQEDRRFQQVAAGDEAGLDPAQRKARRAARKRAKAAKLEREAAEYRAAMRAGKPPAKKPRRQTMNRMDRPMDAPAPTVEREIVYVDDSGEEWDEEMMFDDGGGALDEAVAELSDDDLLAMQGADEETDEGLVEEAPEE